MMKKGMVSASVFAAVLLAATQPATFANAADSTTTTTPATTGTTTDQTATTDSSTTTQTQISGVREAKKVDSLDLEKVIDLAINDSYNLQLLQLKYRVLDQQNASLGLNYVDYLNASPGLQYVTTNRSNEVSLSTGSQTGQTLETNIRDLDTQKLNTQLQVDEAKEGTKLAMTGQYVQLLTLQKQINLSQEYIQVLQRDVQRAQTLQSLGSGTQEDIDKADRALKAEQDNLTSLNDSYQKTLSTLSYDLGIVYDPNIKLADVDVKLDAAPTVDADTLLGKSYQIQSLGNSLNKAEQDEQKAITDNSFEDQANKATTQIAAQQLEQGKVTYAKAIESNLKDMDTALKDVQTAQRSAQDASVDGVNMQIRYNAGVVTKYDLDKYQYQVDASQIKAQLTQLQYYVQKAKVDAMNNGYIASSSSSASSSASSGS
ncbi:TolC family protein [Paenibacillus sp. WLX1005]|uniref:TolC family protein n=1 Tax=Paenibacillus sp. WLX1005 TaxID=3243766 RepID=UPI003983E851